MRLIIVASVLFTLGVLPTRAQAHCDSMDGPVVQAARRAITENNVNFVLIWVQPQQEQVIRDAFSRTQTVRKLGKDAQEMADVYFFETLVRIHRAGEGEPYTGLKPAGYYKEEIFNSADRALQLDSPSELNVLSTQTTQRLLALHAGARAAMIYPPGDIAAGREFVQKYTAYMHFVEELHALASDKNKEQAVLN